jgi:hypothetical protein
VAALVAAPAALAATDVHGVAAAVRTRLGRLLLILVDRALMADLPAALAPNPKRRLKLLIDLLGRLSVRLLTVCAPRSPPRPPRLLLTLTARERRRLTLRRATQLLHPALKLPDPALQPITLAAEPPVLSRSTSFSANSCAHSSPSGEQPPSAKRTASGTGTMSAAASATIARQLRSRTHNPCSTR